MDPLRHGIAFQLLLGLGIFLAAMKSHARADEEAVAARNDILAVTKEVEAGSKISPARVEAIRKKYDDIATIMTVYKPRARDGIGFGPKGRADGIESKLNILADKKGYTQTELEKEASELIKVGHLSAVVAEITLLYAPSNPKAGKGAREWKAHAEDMKKMSFEFVKAVKGGNSANVQKAVNNLTRTCNGCHTDFR